jgi:GNAT superfamily N-acetyltransferase
VEQFAYRLASIDDVETLITLRIEFLAEVINTGLADPIWLDAVRQFLKTTLASGKLVVYLAESNGAAVGVGWLIYHQTVPSPASLTGRDAYVMDIYTRPQFRRRGIARAILQRLLDRARQTDCRRVTLHSVDDARSVYSGLGFVPNDSEMRLDLRKNPR